MPAIKDMNTIVQNWRQGAQASTGRYEQGIRNPKRDWQDATQAAEDNWSQGVQQAISEGRFGRGVSSSSTQDWQRGALEVGTQRWPQGIGRSIEDYQRGFAPFADVIQRTSLSPRGPRGSQQNYQRVVEMGTALHEARQRS